MCPHEKASTPTAPLEKNPSYSKMSQTDHHLNKYHVIYYIIHIVHLQMREVYIETRPFHVLIALKWDKKKPTVDQT